MPYADNFNSDTFDRATDSPEDVLPGEASRVYAAQKAYREAVEAVVNVFLKHGVMECGSIATVAERIAEELHDEVKSDIRELADAGWDEYVTGEDNEGFLKQMDAKLRGKEAA